MSATRYDFRRLLAPRSVAVIGGRWAERVAKRCVETGFDGDIWPVNPTRATMAGQPCFSSLGDLPSPPDAAFIAVNRNEAVNTAQQLREMGAGGAVCFASGFKEAGSQGEVLQQALISAAGTMPLVGPNCYGLINTVDNAPLWPDEHGARPVERGVALLLQSGNIAVNMTMNRRGLPIAYLVALGNQACVDVPDLMTAMADTGRVSAIGLVIEGLGDVVRLAKATQNARAAGVPVVVLKAGRTAEGAALAATHTGSLAGDAAIMDAVMDRCGLVQVHSLTAMMETLKLLHVHGALPDRRLVTMSCSGGEALLLADATPRADVIFSPFTDVEQEEIAPTLHPLVQLANPFDYHTFDWADRPRLTATFCSVAQSHHDIHALVVDPPHSERCRPDDWDVAIDAFGAAVSEHGARGAILASMPESISEARADALMSDGLVPLLGLDDGLTAIAAAANAGVSISAYEPLPTIPALSTTDAPQAVDEWDAFQMLRDGGVPTPRMVKCDNRSAITAAHELDFWPLVAKAVAPTLHHKSEAGAVRLNLRNEDELHDAYRALAELGDYVIVSEMVQDAVAELIVSVTEDAIAGPVLVVGSGGVLTELLGDREIIPLPASRAEISDALGRLKVTHLLDGFRGKPSGDVGAAIEAIERIVALFLAERPKLSALEINPLMVRTRGRGAVAVDVLAFAPNSP